jgi:type I site-specific restriction endonuclease
MEVAEDQNVDINRSLEEMNSNLHELLRFKKEVTQDVVEIARELNLGVDPKDVTGLLQSCDKTLIDKELVIWTNEESGFCVCV